MSFCILERVLYIHQKIGEGQSSNVYLASYNLSNIKAAVKIYKNLLPNNYLIDNCRNESEIMLKLNNHNNIALLVMANTDGELKTPSGELHKVVFIATEYYENGNLLDYIIDSGVHFSERTTRFIFKQLLSGVKEIFSKNLVHRDLKLNNILLDKDFVPKISDFGLSSKVDDNNGIFNDNVGTYGYSSPELIEGSYYHGRANDVFSLGVILFIMVTGSIPFKQATKDDYFYSLILNDHIDEFWESHSKILQKNPLSSQIQELLIGLLQKELKRWTLEEILNSQWLNSDPPDNREYFAEMSRRKAMIMINQNKAEFFRQIYCQNAILSTEDKVFNDYLINCYLQIYHTEIVSRFINEPLVNQLKITDSSNYTRLSNCSLSNNNITNN